MSKFLTKRRKALRQDEFDRCKNRKSDGTICNRQIRKGDRLCNHCKIEYETGRRKPA